MRVALNLGLGDAIACAPIIAKLATENREVIIPSWAHNLESVQSFFVDYPNVNVISYIEHEKYVHEFKNAELMLGGYNKLDAQYYDENFVMWFYRQAGVSQEDRWKWCPIQKAANKIIDPCQSFKDAVLVQYHKDYKLNVQHEKALYTVPLSGSILRYAQAVAHAAEVHVLDSSLLHLAEALTTRGRLIYHQYARPNSTDNYQFRKQWTTIK